jgi:hypothetical protein
MLLLRKGIPVIACNRELGFVQGTLRKKRGIGWFSWYLVRFVKDGKSYSAWFQAIEPAQLTLIGDKQDEYEW